MIVAKAKSTKKKTGKSSKASKGKSRGKSKSEEAAYGLPSDEELEKEAEALAEKKKDSDGEDLHIGQLQKMSIPQLHELAKEESVQEYAGLKKQDLIFKILKERTDKSGLMFGEGVLETLQDGFGFLRSPRYSYSPCPDDIYVSPSQIRRFGMRTGTVISGQIRPPKENERYFALLRVEAINYEEPENLISKANFDDLTPLYPEERLVMELEPEGLDMRIVDLSLIHI